jgi:hypothetical protein
MLMLAVPTFAESSKMSKSNAGVEMNNTQRSMTNGANGNTMNGASSNNGYNTSSRVHSDSTYSTYGNDGTRAYGMDNGRYRTNAANNDRGMDWGWLGLLGLLGLAGMRGRNRDRFEDKTKKQRVYSA